MNERSRRDRQGVDAILANARAVYDDLSSALIQSIATLEEQSETLADANTRQQIAQFHTNTLLQLIEIEVDLESRTDTANGDARSELDLDAARREILERLSRGVECD